jgi:hypothetical protein
MAYPGIYNININTVRIKASHPFGSIFANPGTTPPWSNTPLPVPHEARP